MAKPSSAEESTFAPGKKYSLLGVSHTTSNPWIRWGLPLASGLIGALILWLIS